MRRGRENHNKTLKIKIVSQMESKDFSTLKVAELKDRLEVCELEHNHIYSHT